jgi:hypothetical protein
MAPSIQRWQIDGIIDVLTKWIVELRIPHMPRYHAQEARQ